MFVFGNATLDGVPLQAQFLGAVVRRDRLITPCQSDIPPVNEGNYQIGVLTETQGLGCGAPGAEVVLWTFVNGTKLYSTSAVAWPRFGRVANFDARFSTATPSGAAPPVTELSGEAFDNAQHQLPVGTSVEALVGTTLCGRASVRQAGDTFTGYVLAIVGPDSVPGCTRGAPITFRVDGRRARETYVNQLTTAASGSGGSFPLTQS